MRTRTIKLVILLSFIGQFLFAQGWERIFDIQNTNQDIGDKILLADNGDYLISGYSLGDANFESSMFVSRISPEGNEIWTRLYSSLSQDSLSLLSAKMVKASDGGYILAGTEIGEIQSGTPNKLIIIKIDENNGDTLWTKRHSIPVAPNLPLYQEIAPAPDGGYVVVGINGDNMHSLFVKLDAVGALESFQEIILGIESTSALNIIPTSDGKFLIAGAQYYTSTDYNIFIQKVELNGDSIWYNDFGGILSNHLRLGVTETIDDGFILATAGKIIKVDSVGDIEWQNSNFPGDLQAVSLTADGGYVFTGYFDNGLFNDDLILLKTDSNGEVKWSKLFGGEGIDFGFDVIQIPDSSFIISGSAEEKLYVIRTGPNGNLFDSFVKGRVFKDDDLNCTDDSGEPGMSSNLVQVIGSDTLYTFTDDDGYYEINLDTGSYSVRSILPNPYWNTCIDDPFPFEINNVSDTVTVDLPAQIEIECPYLEVDISTRRLRRCFDNKYDVRYCNSGTAIAEDAIITVILDPFLEYQSSSIALSNQNGDTLVFDIGDIDIYECGVFDITTYLNCDSTVTGQAHCVKALITPDSICLPVDPSWTGASLKVDAECTGDSIFFNIENIGTGNMSSPRNFIVTEDVIMFDEGQVELLSGESLEVFAMEANGSTWRLEVDQVEGHPGESNPSVVVEGCVSFGTPFSQYFTNAFPQDDGDPFVSIDCQESVGSYDTFDKQGFPTGWSDEHFIDQNVDLEYLIRFQNTGSDTVINVLIKDQISPYLDITSFRPGASSHPYELGFEWPYGLTFKFENIMLPDSNVNEAASHGFVKFKISQWEDLPLETLIYNQAGIYFDFNNPELTNETFHKVGEPISTLSFEPPFLENVTINAYPNPFIESTRIEVKGTDFKNLNLELFDIQGRLITSRKAENEQFLLHRNGLTTGIYFYRIEEDGQMIGVGKLIVQ